MEPKYVLRWNLDPFRLEHGGPQGAFAPLALKAQLASRSGARAVIIKGQSQPVKGFVLAQGVKYQTFGVCWLQNPIKAWYF